MVLLAALYVCSGCASVRPLRATGPHEASCDGVRTEVDGESMNLKQAAAFYQERGADEAALLADEAHRLRRTSATRWLIYAGVGAVIGAVAGVAAVSAPRSEQNDPFYGIFALLAVELMAVAGFGLGTPMGLYDSHTLSHDSKEKAIEAAEAYNASLHGAPIPPSHSLPALPPKR